MSIKNSVILILALLLLGISAHAQNSTPETNQSSNFSHNLSVNATPPQNQSFLLEAKNATLGNIVTIAVNLDNLTGTEVVVEKNGTSFRFGTLANKLSFNPKEPGTYTATLLNNSAHVTNVSFNVSQPPLQLIPERESYLAGEEVRVVLKPRTTAAIELEYNGISYRLLDFNNESFTFTPADPGEYVVLATSENITANITIHVAELTPEITTDKGSYAAGEEVGITISKSEPPHKVIVRKGNLTLNIVTETNHARFIAREEGNYTAALLKNSAEAASTAFTVGREEKAVTNFDINSDAAFQLNFTQLLEGERNVFDKLLSTSPLTRLTAYVEGHQDDARFKISLLPVEKDVFVARVHSNPEIARGNYTLVIKALIAERETTEEIPFSWTGEYETETPATANATNITEQEKLLNYSFELGKSAVIGVQLTPHLKNARNIVDNILGRTILNTLTAYVDGHQEDQLFTPQVTHIRNDDFLITIKSSERIKPGLYRLMLVGMTDTAVVRSTTTFSWGLNESEIREKLLEYEAGERKEKTEKFAVVGSRGEAISYELAATGNKTIVAIPPLNLEITFFNFLERGKLSVLSSANSPETFRATQTYVLDPSLLSYDNATVTRKFFGTEIHSCSYDVAAQNCTAPLQQLQIINNSYTTTLNGTTAFFEISKQPEKEAGKLTTAEVVPKFYREMPSLLHENTPATVKFAVISEQKLSNAKILDELPEGWQSTRKLNSTHSLLTFDTEGNITVVEYEITPNERENATFSAKLEYNDGSNFVAKAENEPYKVAVDNKTAIATDVTLKSGSNILGRELATGLEYEAVFTLKGSGNRVDKETIFLWPYDDEIIGILSVTRECRRQTIETIKGTRHLKCTWDNYPESGVKEFTASIKANQPGANHSSINVTYDPPKRVYITELQNAPYDVEIRPEIKGENLLIDISHEHDGPLAIAVDGNLKYIATHNSITKGETATILVENYDSEYFTITVGQEKHAFGEPVTNLVEQAPRKEKTALGKIGEGIASAVKSIVSGIRDVFTGALKLIATVPRGITGLIATDVEQPAQENETIIAEQATVQEQQEDGETQRQQQETVTAHEQGAEPQQPAQQVAEIDREERQQQERIAAPQRKKPETRAEFTTPGKGGVDITPIIPEKPEEKPKEKPKKKVIEEKIFISTLQPFTFAANDIDVPFNLTGKVKRSISCSKCDDFSVPGKSEVTIKVELWNFRKLENATFTEYYPSAWTVTDAGNGSMSNHNSTHNRITWAVESASSEVERKYAATTPKQVKNSYNFHSEVETAKNKIVEENHKVFVEPFELVVETPQKKKFKSKAKIVNVIKETKEDITVDLEINFSTKKIGKVTLTNVTLQKNSTINLGFDEVPETKAEFTGTNFVKVYALDPSNLTFETGLLSATAEGTKLVKCAEWDFNSQKCNGKWKTILNLTPGTPYEVELNATDPAWAEIGLVAINTHKSIYLPGELAKIGIGVLDNNGRVVCDANVTLVITTPAGTKITFTTENGSIAISDQCRILGVTNEPDYFTNYTVNELGSHEMNLTAITYDGEPFMISNFSVQPAVRFDVERIGPTRIFPLSPYDFNFSITANEDFAGNITEFAPATFSITNTTGMVIAHGNATQLIVWNTTLVNGTTQKLGYAFDAPDESPFRYELGPLHIGTWQEARQWQIASDAPPGTWIDKELNCNPSSVKNGSSINCTITYTCTGNNCVNGPGGFYLEDDGTRIDDALCADIDLACGGVTVTGNCTDTAENDATCRGGYSSTGCPVGQALVVDYSFTACSGVEAPTALSSITADFEDDGQASDSATLDESINVEVLETNTPNVTIVLPLSDTNISGNFVVNASANDSQSNLSQVNLSLLQPGSIAAGPFPMNLSQGSILEGYFNTTFDSSTVDDGVYNLSVNATDSAGNTNISANVSVTIDNTAANVTIATPINVSNFSTDFVINASVNDSTSTVLSVSYKAYNSTTNATEWLSASRSAGTATEGYWNTTIAVAVLNDGFYNITINATDFAGNQIVANISQFLLDTQATANISIIEPVNGAVISETITINSSVNDTASFTGSVAYRLMNQTVSSSWTSAARTSGNTSQGYWTADFNTVVLDDGLYNISVNATDFAGNQQLVNISQVEIDNIPDVTAPNISIVFPQSNANISSTILVNASINDTGGTVQHANLTFYNSTGNATGQFAMSLGAGSTVKGYWNASVDTTPILEGTYNLSVNATDAKGNTNISGNVSVVIDNTNANASATAPANGSTFSDETFQVTASANDSLTGVFNVSFRLHKTAGEQLGEWHYAGLDSGTIAAGEWSATLDTTAISSGTYNITINATDFAGNQYLSNSSEITVSNTPPNVSIVAPSDGNYSATILVNASVNSSATVTDANLSLLQPGSVTAGPIAMQLTSGTATSGYWTVNFDSTTIGDGAYNLSVNASFGSGNYNLSQNVSVIIDNSPPNTTVIDPLNNSIVSDMLVINASVNDTANEALNVTFRFTTFNGRVVSSWQNATLGQGTRKAGYWNSTFDTTTLENNEYNITVNATDTRGNQLIANLTMLTIDNQNRAAGENENFLLRAQSCNREADVSCGPSATSCETFSSACAGTYPAECSTDRLSCNDVVNESSATSNNNWAGVNVTSFNSSINNCESVTNVRVCFDWYLSGTARDFFNCNLGVDNDGDLSWTTTAISCPTTTDDILTCVDVTSQEGVWLCDNFFGISQPAAWAYVEGKRTEGGGGTTTVHVDVLYFNVTFEIDKRSPNVSILQPQQFANISGSLLINASINETTEVTSANFTVYNNTHNITALSFMSNGTGNTTIGYWNATLDSLNFPDGRYNITVFANDTSGQFNTSENRSITIDNTASNATIIVPVNNTLFAGADILMNASINDSASGVRNASFRITNSDGTTATSWLYAVLNSGSMLQGYWSATRTSATLPNDRYNITLNATDFAGNRIVINVSEIEVEIAAPNVSAVQPQALANISSALFVNASVNTTGVIGRANASLHNNTGNATGYFALSLTSGTASAGYWTATIDTSAIVIDGLYNLSVNATDAGGNMNVSPNITVIIDNTPPNITAVTPENDTSFQNEDIIINASVNDTLTKAFNVSYRLTRSDGSTVTSWYAAHLNTGTIEAGYWNATIASTSVPNGNYNITANATDFAGAQKLVNISEITIDNILPNVSIIIPAQQYLNLSGTFLVNASVNSSTNDVTDVNLSLLRPGNTAAGPIAMELTSGTASSGYRTANFDSTTVADGTYNLSVNATDAVQNTKISGNVSVIIDNTAANVTIITPENGTNNLDEFLINASVNDTLTKVFNATFRITDARGTSVTEWIYATLSSGTITSGYWNASFDPSTIEEGRYNITVNATDFAGNQNVVNVTEFITDSVKPNVTILAPLHFSNISGLLSVSASVNDTAAGVQFVNFTVYNHTGNTTPSLEMALSSGSIISGIWDGSMSSLLPDGSYNVSINATDYGKNVNISANRSIVVDNTLPNTSAVLPTNDTVFEENLILINASVNDSVSRVFNATFRLMKSDGSIFTPWIYATLNSGTIDQGYWNASYDSSSLVNGDYNITVNATDFAGNQKLSNISQIEVANVPPNNTVVFPISGANISGSMLVNASINDSGEATWVNLTIFNNTGNVTAFIPMSLGSGTESAGFWNATVDTAVAIPRDGNYNLSVNATDGARNINISENVSVVIDNTLPNTTTISPANRSNHLGELVINASVNDSVTGLLNVSFRLTTATGSTVTEWLFAEINSGTIDQGYWNATIDMSTVEQGKYNITINATDFAGNQLIANLSEIFSDDVAPNNTIVNPVNNANISGEFSINASVNDTATGAVKANLTILNNTGNATGFLMMTNNMGDTISGYWNHTFPSTTLPDGRYNLSVNATDDAGNINISENVSITIDNTAANVTAISPANGTIFEETAILINASINDTPSRILNATFRLTTSDGLTVTEWLFATLNSGTIDQGYWNASISSTTIPNGLYNITANATDFAGNQKLVNISEIEVSNIAPNATIIIPLSGKNVSGSMLVNASINDSGIVDFVNLTIHNNTGNVTSLLPMELTSGTTGNGYWTLSVETTALIPRDGNYNLSVNATDTIGNINISGNVSVVIDNTLPNATATAPANGSVYDNEGILINATANDSVTGIFNASFRAINELLSTAWLYAELNSGSIGQGYWNATLDSGTLGDGSYNITVNATDFAGNQQLVNISQIVVDNDAPNATIIIPEAKANVSGSMLINASINDSTTVTHVNATLYNNTGNATSFILMTLGAGSTTSGYWNATLDTTALADGQYNVSVNATNQYGNTNISQNVSLTIDNTAANITIAAPANGTNRSGIITINASINDTPSRVLEVSFIVYNNTHNVTAQLAAILNSGSIDNGYWDNKFDTTTLRDGTYNITANTTDFAGNNLLVNISSFEIDNTLPTITLNAPPNYTSNNTRNVSFTASVNDNSEALQSCSLLLNGTANKTISDIAAGQEHNFTVQNFNEGAYLWNVECEDTAGNTNRSQANFTLFIDLNAPLINITTSNETFFNISAPNITVNITDTLDTVLNYTLFADGEKDNNGTVLKGTTANLTLLAKPDGEYAVIAEAADDSNNRTNSSEINITIDTTLPLVRLIGPANNTNVTTVSVQFNFTANDTIDAHLDCGLHIDGIENVTTALFRDNSTNITIANFTTGVHGWNVSCYDDAKNLNWSQNYFFNVTRADLAVESANISFNTSTFEEERNFTLFVNVSNIGDGEAQNARVEFLNTTADGNLLGEQFVSLLGGENVTLNLSVKFPIGTYAIVVRLDGNDNIPEVSEDNNVANKTFLVPLWNDVVGNVTGDLIISDTNDTFRVFDWPTTNQTTGNVFVTDIDSEVSWSNLTALTRNITGNLSFDDFAQLDTALNTTGYNDSINRTYSSEGQLRENLTFTMFTRNVAGVPVVNSTNTSSFRTGILWDVNDSIWGEFNGSEDVVFVTQINRTQEGKYGYYDFELRVPAKLRQLKEPDLITVVYYLELK